MMALQPGSAVCFLEVLGCEHLTDSCLMKLEHGVGKVWISGYVRGYISQAELTLLS